ncbi:DUF7507 domain-containing protein [Ferrimicrobium acidiphilum]|uniref:DUF7507 domain-containing protein n=1 Tax=Ferrimicrobium acidiphilum TaxID=121039 RepID=UPI0023F2FE19|nr:hypothetical protein [Ferrimicrobium acidiphilum]
MGRVRIVRNSNSVKASRVLRATVATITLAGGVAFMATGPNVLLSSSHSKAKADVSQKVETDSQMIQATNEQGKDVGKGTSKVSPPSEGSKPGSSKPGGSTTGGSTTGGSTTVSLHNAGVSSSGVPNACSLAPESGSSASDWLFILTGLNGNVAVPQSVSITWQPNGTTSSSGDFTTTVGLTVQDGHSGHYLVYMPGYAPVSGTAAVSSNWKGEFVISGGPGCTSSGVAVNHPSLYLTKTEASGPYPVTAVGQIITYDFVVTNNGNVNLTGLTVHDTQSVAGESLSSGPSCNITSLAVGADAVCTGKFVVTSADISDGEVNDTAVAHAYDGTTSVTSNIATLSIPVVVTVSTPSTSSSSTSGHLSTSTSGHSPSTSSSSTPSSVRLVTGPRTPPSSTSPALPIGLAIAGLGLGGLGYVAIQRKRLNLHGHTNEVG